jgi:hypothetical protein
LAVLCSSSWSLVRPPWGISWRNEGPARRAVRATRGNGRQRGRDSTCGAMALYWAGCGLVGWRKSDASRAKLPQVVIEVTMTETAPGRTAP